MKKAIIVGASSGIGREVAKLLIADGWRLGIAARREEPLLELKAQAASGSVEVMCLDVTKPDAGERLLSLIERLGGIDLYFHASGIGKQNRTLDDLKHEWIDEKKVPCIFMSALSRNGLPKLRSDLYKMVAEIHAGRWPFNNFLW